jgi:hypothetical protein
MADAAIAQPVPRSGRGSSDDIPDAENIDKLFELHKETVAATKALCPDVHPQAEFPYFDDLWFLRYVLSFKQADKAAEAIRKCLAWRAESAVLLAMHPKDPFHPETWDGPMGHLFGRMAKYQVATVWTPDALADHGFVVILRGALSKPKMWCVPAAIWWSCVHAWSFGRTADGLGLRERELMDTQFLLSG